MQTQCLGLHNYAEALLLGVPKRYCTGKNKRCSPVALSVANSVVKLDSVLGAEQMDRETFVPAVIHALDCVSRLASLALVKEDESDEIKERTRIAAKAAAQKARARSFRQQRSAPGEFSSEEDQNVDDHDVDCDDERGLRRTQSHLPRPSIQSGASCCVPTTPRVKS